MVCDGENRQNQKEWQVLILVLMEYGLRQVDDVVNLDMEKHCLNPCFNGIWSATAPTIRLCV